MKVSILTVCPPNQNYLEAFYSSLLQQTHLIHELILILPNSDQNQINAANQIRLKAPFTIHTIETEWKNTTTAYFKHLNKATGELILFAQPNVLFAPKKIALFVDYAERNPYEFFFFANQSVGSTATETEIYDYFGITGFHERWDYYKNVNEVLTKQIGFVPTPQTAIRSKAAAKILQFYEDYQHIPTIDFGSFLAIYFGMYDLASIREIPYVLSHEIASKAKINHLIQQGSKLHYNTNELVNWLQEYSAVATLINSKHQLIARIQSALQFHKNRIHSTQENKFTRSLQLLTGQYHKHSFEPFYDWKQDWNTKK